MNEPKKTTEELQLYPSAVAAARAMPPLADEAIAELARILAGIEARRTRNQPAPSRHAA